MEQKHIIFHIDVNSAFLSWESAYRLEHGIDTIDLRTIPSAIGGNEKNRHGIILAKSTPAKKYRIHTGEPLVKARQKCPDLVIVPPHYPEYVKRSKAFIQLLSRYCDQIQQMSIDEAFLDMTSFIKLFGDPVSIADQIRNDIETELGFTVNIGISTNTLLAKMASDFEKPNRTHTLWREEIPAKMWPLPVSELYFVGRSACEKLHALGIQTIKDLALFDTELLQAHIGKKYGQTIHDYANGIASDTLEEPEANKGIGNSVTLSSDITDWDCAYEVLLSLAETVGYRLREEHKECKNITVEIKDWNFKRTSHQTTLQDSTDSTYVIYETACMLLQEHWDGTPLRLFGIRTGKLSDPSCHQMSFFDTKSKEKEKKLEKAVDSIRNRYGVNSIKRARFIDEHAVTRHIHGKENR